MATDLETITVVEGIETRRSTPSRAPDRGTIREGFLWAPALSTPDTLTYLRPHAAERAATVAKATTTAAKAVS